MALERVETLVNDIRAGKMIVLVDDEDRENEGDLVMAASYVQADDINFMAKHARGLICLTLSAERCRQLGLDMMVDHNQSRLGTNFTVSIDASAGVTTGISAADRALTIQKAVSPDARPADIVQPGHVFPIRAESGGVLTRAGHTEAGSDLARLAGLEPAAVIVEIMKEDGTMARRPDLEVFAKEHGLHMGAISDLVHHRVLNERTIKRIDSDTVKTRWGDFALHHFEDSVYGYTHLALAHGDIKPNTPTPVRVHVPELMRDLIGVEVPESRSWDLQKSLAYIASQDAGVVVLIGRMQTNEELRHSMNMAFGKLDEVDNELPVNALTMVGIGAQILRDLGVSKMRLMAQPAHYSIAGFGLDVVEYISPEPGKS
jgi:3,4-dihydroxy 2-butanone 4-phosphate synthase/GTP cyclohydrolase II